jgi:hypothetical protein
MHNVAVTLVKGRASSSQDFRSWRVCSTQGLNKLEAAMQQSVAPCWGEKALYIFMRMGTDNFEASHSWINNPAMGSTV